jgi:endoglucanase
VKLGRRRCVSLVACAFAGTIAACGATTPDGARPPAPASALAPAPSAAPAAGGELLQRSTFKDGGSLPWMPLFIAPAKGEVRVVDGAYCARIDQAGNNAWEVQLRHREMTIVKGHTYAVHFSAWASAPIKLRSKVGMSGAPYTTYWNDVAPLTTERKEVRGTFSVHDPDDPTAEFAFHLSDPGMVVPVTVCVDDLHLTDPAFTPVAKAGAARPPAIRVNQIGYFPKGAKRATWVIEGADAEAKARTAVPFEVVDAKGTVVHRGTTQPFGKDPTSGAFVQRIDFSSYTAPGEGLRVRIGGGTTSDATSDAFAIQEHVLRPLSRDALRYFYQTRSGIVLEQPYVEDAKWARPAGHPTDVKVPCAPDAGCTHVLDVSGGWYDAGDYGKYVVNGGLSVWLLLNLWEVSREMGFPIVGAKDGDLHVPESGNKKPDLLDEARWELEWMLKMQVPEGDPQAGLVHHKMHDVDWSALGSKPVRNESVPRQLRPVSTAATLNLAAVAAQAARVYATIDPAFAQRCLAAAKRAWAAAEAHPALLITGADNHGGGAYEDADVSDERFWAATELFVTTGDEAWNAVLAKSPYLGHVRFDPEGVPQAFDWRTMDALGAMTLSLASPKVSAKVREGSRRALVAVAERFLALSTADGFGQPYSGATYHWGSNSAIVNNGVVLAYAHAFTKDRRFYDAAAAAADYVLGRNAMGKSYVSGYGARPLTNPHHRYWAHSVDSKLPGPPPGVLSGGPNSDLQDPYSKALHPHCIGQTCYVDHIDAYSANEVAINWNAELAWLVAYLDAAS